MALCETSKSDDRFRGLSFFGFSVVFFENKSALRHFAACLIGCVVVVYAFGITMQSVLTGVPVAAIAIASTGFIIGDLIKAAVATLAVAGISRLR